MTIFLKNSLDTNNIISDKIELHFVERPKFKFAETDRTVGKEILKLLTLKSEEEVETMNTNTTTEEIQDLIIRIKAFNTDELAKREFYERKLILMDELRNKQNEERRKQVELKAIGTFFRLFVKELVSTAKALPEYAEECGGEVTPANVLRIAVKDDLTSLDNALREIMEFIDDLLSLDVTFEAMAEQVNSTPEDVKAFYEKYRPQTVN